MIRPLSLLCVLLAAGSGLYLYQAKQHGRMLDQQIRETRELTERTRQRIEVLRADYTLLNDPSRLAELVGANLPDLKPTQPAQWTSMADLTRLASWLRCPVCGLDL
ncbi:MAG: ABC transporter permease, partial [Alphaproteobacteria bacterium]|nr:ABC transporter permease [Alphaproteobacteria bacterium]